MEKINSIQAPMALMTAAGAAQIGRQVDDLNELGKADFDALLSWAIVICEDDIRGPLREALREPAEYMIKDRIRLLSGWQGHSIEDVEYDLIDIRLWSHLGDELKDCYRNVAPKLMLGEDLAAMLPIRKEARVLFQDIDGNAVIESSGTVQNCGFYEMAAAEGDLRKAFLLHTARKTAWDKRVASVLPAVLEYIDRNGGAAAWIGKEADAIHEQAHHTVHHHLESDYGLYIAEVLHETLKEQGARADRPFRPHRKASGNWRYPVDPFKGHVL